MNLGDEFVDEFLALGNKWVVESLIGNTFHIPEIIFLVFEKLNCF